MVVTIHQAKTNLSKLIAQAEAGEEIVISRGNTPVAKLVPMKPKAKRQAGRLKGQIVLTDAFFERLPDDELALWNGEGD
ncbi:MAG: antitoxin [Caulobacter sp.]|nr:antitoxin [Caulobacter sp.]